MTRSHARRRGAPIRWVVAAALGLGAVVITGCGRGAAPRAAPSTAAGPEWNGRALAEWTERFRSHDNAMCVEAGVALSKIGGPAVPALVIALRNDPDNLVREEAARVLARIGPSTVAELARTFLDAPPAAQASAREAIASMGPAALHELVKLLKGGDKAGKIEALGLLERLGAQGREACGAIDDARRDLELGVRIRAGALLQKMCR